MKIKHLLFLLSVALFFNCGNGTSETPSSTEEKSNSQTLKITQKVIEQLKYNDYVLSTDAQKAVANWINYQELTTQIGFLKKRDFSFFKGEETVMTTFIADLKTNIPEIINTNPIKARITVVETTLLKLNNDLLIDNLPTEEKLESIKTLLVAVSNFNYLINKKLEFDKTDIGRPE
jgi:hypothetical protein